MTFTAPWLNVRLLDIMLLDIASIEQLGLKLVLNMAVTLVIVLLIYRPTNDKPEYTFTYLIFNILIFFICYLMASIPELGIGFGFGLFALFSIMRYRTMTISIKDMTYLFAVVCIAVINAVGGLFDISELLLINLFIAASIFIFEKLIFRQVYDVKKVTYEYVDRITPEREEELIADLEKRTGRKVAKVDVWSMNYLNDSAVLRVYFEPLKSTARIRYKEPLEDTTQNIETKQPSEYEGV